MSYLVHLCEEPTELDDPEEEDHQDRHEESKFEESSTFLTARASATRIES
jgi:hypothetical protein